MPIGFMQNHSHPNPNIKDLPISGTINENGWIDLPGGLIIQWGLSTSGNVNFPKSFPNKCFVVSHSKTGYGRDTRIRNVTKSGFESLATGPVNTTYYIAIGN